MLDRQQARQRASGLLLATDVAEYLVAHGVAFREAHAQVGGIVRRLAADGRDFGALSIDEWKTFSPLFDADILDVVTADSAVAARRTPQSTNPAAVKSALDETLAWLDRARAAG
jgi:argininosuccinate lyase